MLKIQFFFFPVFCYISCIINSIGKMLPVVDFKHSNCATCCQLPSKRTDVEIQVSTSGKHFHHSDFHYHEAMFKSTLPSNKFYFLHDIALKGIQNYQTVVKVSWCKHGGGKSAMTLMILDNIYAVIISPWTYFSSLRQHINC